MKYYQNQNIKINKIFENFSKYKISLMSLIIAALWMLDCKKNKKVVNEMIFKTRKCKNKWLSVKIFYIQIHDTLYNMLGSYENKRMRKYS